MNYNILKGIRPAVFLLTLLLIPLAIPGEVIAATGNITSCSDCHGYPPVDSATRDSATGSFTGNHSTHFSAGNCQICHNSVGATEYNHSLKSASGGVNYINMTGVIHNSRMGAAAKYNKGVKFAQSATPVLSTCSSVNCHFETVTPTWGQAVPWSSTKTAGNNDANCAQCHLTTALSTGNHAKHITAGGGTQVACSRCHPDYNSLAGTAAFSHTTSTANPIQVSFAAAPNLGGAYAGGRTGNNYLPSAAQAATGSCSALYCHSPGTKSASYDPPNTNPVTWGNTLDCKGCHSAQAFSGAEMSTGSHKAHINNALAYTAIKCVACHATTATDSMTIANVASHVNKSVDVAFSSSSSAANGSYNGSLAKPGSPSSKLPGTAAGTCQNVYCHSTGQHSDGTALVAGDYATPSWSGSPASGQCGTCHGMNGTTDHGGFPGTTNGSLISSGKHAKHLTYNFGIASSDMRCAICHSYDKTAFSASGATCGTVCHGGSPNNTGAKHANYEVNVNIASYFGATASYSGTTRPGDGYGSCSLVYCHSDGQATPAYDPTLSWSDSALTCASCHGSATVNSPGGTALSGKHAAHVNPAVNAQLGTGNGFGCVECHMRTVASNTALNPTTGTTLHVNKFVEYSGLRAGGPSRYNSATKQCSNFYCHSNGKAGTAVAEFKNPPVWSSVTTLGCNGCHGNNTVSPDGANPTNANLGQPNYTNGGAGTAAANSHKKHVIDAGISNTTGCYNCHSKTVDKNVASRFRPYSTTHVSGGLNIVFAPSIGGTYTPGVGSKTCASTACHGAGTPQWGGASLACNACHSSNNSGYWATNSSHRQHWEDAAVLPTSYTAAPGNTGTATTYRFQCSSCHASTAAHSNLTNAASTFGSAEVFFGYTSSNRKGSYTYAGATAGTEGTIKWTAGGNCATTYCHSDGNGGGAKVTAFTWNSPNNTLRCNGCHGSQDWKLSSVQPAYSSIRTQAHARHVRGDINTEMNKGNGLDCVRCHAKTVSAALNSYSTVSAGVLKKNAHVNKMRDYSGVSNNPISGTSSNGQFNPTTHNCSNVYCHSNAKISTSVAKFSNPAAWNSGVTNQKCNYCHGRQGHAPAVSFDNDAAFSRYSSTGVPNYTSGAGGADTANSHRQHIAQMGTTDYSDTQVCYSCHSATLDISTGRAGTTAKFRPYSARHTSGAFNIKFKASIGGSYAGGTGNKNCSSTLCHGGTSPKWGANTTNDGCTKCHGTPSASVTATTKYLVAPPLNTSQVTGTLTGTGQVSNNPKVGAHQTHIRFTNGFSNYSTQTFRCENCHGTTLPTTTAHITGSSAPAFQGLATKRGAMSPVWTSASLTCSNTYCHNPAGTGGTLNSANVGLRTFVSWTAATYLGDTAKTQANCNRCHKSPGDAGFTSPGYNHGAMVISADCAGCHEHNGNSAGIVGRRHLDGIKYGGGDCDNCHGYQSGTWGVKPVINTGGVGAHEKHVVYLATKRFAVTLVPTSDQYGSASASWTNVCGVCHIGGTHMDNTVDVYKSSNAAYFFGTAGSTTYQGIPGTTSAANPKTCSNISCHYFTTPVWSTP